MHDTSQVARRRSARLTPRCSCACWCAPPSSAAAAPYFGPARPWSWLPPWLPPCSTSTWTSRPKLRREFRKYGANVVVVARDGQSFEDNALSTYRSARGQHRNSGSFAYAVARTLMVIRWSSPAPIWSRSRSLNSTWWKVNFRRRLLTKPWLARVASVVGASGKPFDLSFQGRTIRLNSSGTLQTGADGR